ncbi:MAG: elongation factor P [Acidobacteria bacterium]|nr:elongation factor P [Acidobacteriota bacterium]
MISTDKFRKKLKVEIDGEPWMMIDVEHVRPGKGQGFTRTKMKNMVTGQVVERTYKSNETLNPARIDAATMQYLYQNGDDYSFMNTETYDQVNLTAEQLGDVVNYLYENMECEVAFFNGMPISCDMANFVELEIVECEPGIKGNTATNTLKPAIVSSGYRAMVPLFVEQGDWIRIDTRTGDYVERCKRPEGR